MADVKKIIKLLESIAVRPNMYFYDGSFVSATGFISGFLYSIELENLNMRYEFSMWMQKKYNKTGALSFESVSIVYFDEQEKAGNCLSEREKVKFLFENLIKFIKG